MTFRACGLSLLCICDGGVAIGWRVGLQAAAWLSPDITSSTITQARVDTTDGDILAKVKPVVRSTSRGHHPVISGAYSLFSKMDSDEIYAAAIQDLQEILGLKVIYPLSMCVRVCVCVCVSVTLCVCCYGYLVTIF